MRAAISMPAASTVVLSRIAWERLDVELVGDLLEHATLLDAGRLLGALHVDRDLRLDLLVEADLEQIDVQHLVPNGMALLVLDDHRAVLPPTWRSISAEPSTSTCRRRGRRS